MKRYNWIIGVSLILYLLLAVFSFQALNHVENENRYGYRIEVNRIMKALEEQPDTVIYTSDFQYVKEIQRLPEDANQEEVQLFYSQSSLKETIIQPLYHNGTRLGYVKVLYELDDHDYTRLLWILQGTLATLEVFLIMILIYLKHRMILPFQRLIALPKDMSEGHYQGSIKREKSKYLDSFFWQISQLQDSLVASRKRQLNLEKEKKEMLLSLSHDIKTPLNLIHLYAKALAEDVVQDENQRQLAALQIEKKSQEIEGYVQQIMKASREDLLDIQVTMDDFYLKDLMDQVLATYKEQCALRYLQLQVEPYENRILKGDIHRLQEVMENLFENAFKYGDGIRITISFEEEDYCQLIRVYNSGEPIHEQDWNHLFDSFYRGANAKSKDGTGLGLYICKEIMRKMGGDIFAEKKEGGTAFVLVLPL